MLLLLLLLIILSLLLFNIITVIVIIILFLIYYYYYFYYYCFILFLCSSSFLLLLLLLLPKSYSQQPPPSYLGELTNDAVALVADQRLDLGDGKDCVWTGTDLDARSGVREEFEPPVSGEALGDDDALGAGLVVDLKEHW